MSAPDYSRGLEDLAGLITFRVGAWHDFGYEVPPAPECKTIPPLGERSAEAIKAGHEAIEAIDELSRQMYRLREQLVGELRRDEDLRAARVDALLARLRQEREEEASAEAGLPRVRCLRTVRAGESPRQCGLPVDHEPTGECPGNPHARLAACMNSEDGAQ